MSMGARVHAVNPPDRFERIPMPKRESSAYSLKIAAHSSSRSRSRLFGFGRRYVIAF
jgi:hypothetical protein